MAQVWRYMFLILPSWVQALLFVFLALIVIVIIVRVVSGILSAIPFL